MNFITQYNTVNINGYDQSTINWLNQLTVAPSANYSNAINTLVVQLKLAGIWQQLDRFWIHATQQQQHARVDLITGATLTEVNAPSWVALSGYSSNGTSSYVNSNYNPATGATNFTLNNNSSGVYCVNNIISGNMYDIGNYDGTYLNAFSIANNSSNLIVYNNASSNGGTGTGTATDSYSLFAQGRTTSAGTSSFVMKRGVSITLTVNAGTAVHIPSYPIFINAINGSGSPINYSTRIIAMTFFGSGNINQAIFYNIFQQFAITIGFVK